MTVLTSATPPVGSIAELQPVLDLCGTPDGMIARFVVQDGDGLRVFAAWQSAEHAMAFAINTLAPAISQVVGAPAGVPELKVYEVVETFLPELSRQA